MNTIPDLQAIELEAALASDQFRLEFQPKMSLTTNRIVGVEALLRWDHPQRGSLLASDFMALAEASGQIVPIGAWAIREACRQVADWRRGFPHTTLQLAVNVSTGQLQAGLAESIRAVMADQTLAVRSISLEMTETTVMGEQMAQAVATLDELKRLGLAISIDDFGTGYSTLEHLYQLPIDEVKIDCSFIAGLGADRRCTAIVASIVSMAHAMHIDVVAEGVETLDQLDALRALGCDFAQGYFIAAPMSADHISQLLAADAIGQRLIRSELANENTSGSDSMLVVDDDPDSRRVTTMALAAAGFTVHTAGDGGAGLALARQLVPTCVLVDTNIRDMKAIDVCRALRADASTRGCTVLVRSPLVNATQRAETFLTGADDYVVRPIAPRDLVVRVRSAIDQARTAQPHDDVDVLLLDILQTTHQTPQEVLPETERLSTRQAEIIRRLLVGERVPRIARDLYVSQSTVRNHLSAIYRRFGVHSQDELIHFLRGRSRPHRDLCSSATR